MKRLKRTAVLALLLALLLALPCRAEHETPEYDFSGLTLDDILGRFMDEKGLNEQNFAMGWYDTGTGETWYFNADQFWPAGSMYKLPLNMEFERRLDAGELSPDQLVGGYTVDRAMYLSIVCSNNEVSQAMRNFLTGDRDQYRELLNQFSGLEEDELPPEYYSDNCMSPRFMLNTLRCLYDGRDSFDMVIGLMKQAHPDAYFRKYQGEYEIAHKYGSFEGMLNDCAIVYTPTPFLLTAFTKNVAYNEEVLGSLCELLTQYSLYRDAQAEAAAREEAARREEELARAREESALIDAQLESALREREERAEEALPSPVPDAAPKASPAETAPSGSGSGAARLVWTAGACVLLLAAGGLWSLKKRDRGSR